MTAFEILCAFLTLAAGGLGIALLALPLRGVNAVELAGLSVIFGGALVSGLLFILGFALRGGTLMIAVSICCLCAALSGIVRLRRVGSPVVWPKPRTAFGWFICALLLAQLFIAALQTLNLPLRWDGLLNWEFKARMAFLGGGRIPAAYYTDPSRQWTHPNYPLCIPLVECWFYAWIGRADQEAAKLPFVPLYFAAAALLFAGGKKLSGEAWRGAVAAALMFFVPSLLIEPGSTASGWADGALAIVYLAAVIYLLEYSAAGARRALWLCGACAAILPWVKQEGIVLWACLMLIALAAAWRRHETRVALAAAIPGAAAAAGWKLFLTLEKAPPSGEFLPVNIDTFAAHIGRLSFITTFLLKQIVEWRQWNVLWIAAIFALWTLGCRANKAPARVLAYCILLPVGLLSSTYIFSSWEDFRLHVTSSLPRLLIDVAPAALLAVALALPRRAAISRSGGDALSSSSV